MSTVYRARHEVIGREVAIKVLSASLLSDPASRSRFLREAKAVNRIAHDHIIDISDYGETEDGRLYLVMEYLRGHPLDDVIRREGPFPVSRAMEIARQVCLALGRAHHAGVVHRDVKPENVFLLERKEGGDFVKLLDFGLAHVKGEGRITATGAVFGTPDYMSPEQVRGKGATARSDLYAVGCLLFEMLTSRPPFVGSTATVLRGHLHEPPPALSDARTDVPEPLERLVASLLAKEPARRPPSALLVADRLAGMLRRARTDASGKADEPPSIGGLEAAVAGAADPRGERPPASLSNAVGGVDAWRRRLERFEALLDRLPPRSTERGLLQEAVVSLRGIVTRMSALQEALHCRDSRHDARRRERRALKERIGSALDALGRDEARLRERMAAVRKEAETLAARHGEAGGVLLQCWQRAGAPPERTEALARDAVEALLAAGEPARRWLHLQRELEAQREALARMESEREDLHFQIIQLRGRLASIGAEDDFERDVDDSATSRGEMAALHEEASRCIEPVVRRLLALPALRAELLGPPPDPGT